jgi:general secretion pathway protein K
MRTRRGGALLAVLWLVAALSAIAFAVASSVRGEAMRAGTSVDGVKAYYLATGAIDRALLYMVWGDGVKWPNGVPRYWVQGRPVLRYEFPTGEAVVELVPESAKLHVNEVKLDELMRLLAALGVPPQQGQQIAMAIVDWRTGSPAGMGMFDGEYLQRVPSFRARHASFEQIEELLLVRGVTTELFYGRVDRAADGSPVQVSGLRDCLSVYPAEEGVDVNTADPAVLAAVRVPPAGIAGIVQQRAVMQFQQAQWGTVVQMAGPAAGQLRIGGWPIYTLRATARVRQPDGKLAETRRSVAATVQFIDLDDGMPYRILEWHDNAAGEMARFRAWPD